MHFDYSSLCLAEGNNIFFFEKKEHKCFFLVVIHILPQLLMCSSDKGNVFPYFGKLHFAEQRHSMNVTISLKN